MRITNNLISRNAVTGLQLALRRVDEAQRRATTGLRVAIASDDPAAANSIMGAGSSLRALEQYQRNINAASARVTHQETALDSLTRILERAKELGMAQGNATASTQTRMVAKAEVDQLLAQAVQLGNVKHEGEYLFGGDQSDVVPFTSFAPPFSTNPPAGTRRAEISSALAVRTNHNGSEVFLQSGALAALHDLSVALGADDGQAILTSLGAFDIAHLNVQVITGETGAAASQLEVASSNLVALDTSLRSFKSNLQDADLERAVTELVARQTAYQSAMLATSRVLGLSLAEYLR